MSFYFILVPMTTQQAPRMLSLLGGDSVNAQLYPMNRVEFMSVN